jgi:hypothetical protein
MKARAGARQQADWDARLFSCACETFLIFQHFLFFMRSNQMKSDIHLSLSLTPGDTNLKILTDMNGNHSILQGFTPILDSVGYFASVFFKIEALISAKVHASVDTFASVFAIISRYICNGKVNVLFFGYEPSSSTCFQISYLKYLHTVVTVGSYNPHLAPLCL